MQGDRPARIARRRRSERGQAAVEFALGATLFLMTLFGTLEFARAVWQYNLLADLAQEGARWASVRGSGSGSPASEADVQTFVQSRALSFAVTVTTTPAPSTLLSGATVTVAVQSTFTPVVGSLVPISTMPLQSTARMVMAR